MECFLHDLDILLESSEKTLKTRKLEEIDPFPCISNDSIFRHWRIIDITKSINVEV